MPRPSISGWFDSKIQIYRPTASKDAVGVQENTYVPLAEVECAIDRSRSANTAQGGGNAETGTLRWYGQANIDVQPRDVCAITEGPDAGTTWEVDSYPVRPRGHHTQVDCVEWNGELPGVTSE